MKKTIILSTAIMTALVVISLSFASCSQKTTEEPKTTEQPKTAYEQLNDDEKSICDKILNHEWRDPPSVRILDVKYGAHYIVQVAGDYTSRADDYCWCIQINAPTVGGGNMTVWYRLDVDGHLYNDLDLFWKFESLSEMRSVLGDLREIKRDASVTKINAALKEHWEELGI